MMMLVKKFEENIEEKELFGKEDELLLALSGGADSVALFHLLKSSGYNFKAAHINYGLRGAESDEDQKFVEDLCKEYSVKMHLHEVDPEHWKQNLNVQNEARRIRYEFFSSLPCDLVLTAHHLDDQVETILQNISRGSGLKGLLGIRAKRGKIIRPLLSIEKTELIDFLREEGLTWREDSSNASDKYKRNRFRNSIIPSLKEENPSLNDAIQRLIENVEPYAIQEEKDFVQFKDEKVGLEDGMIRIDKDPLSKLEKHLYDLLLDYGYTRSQVKDILRSVDQVGKEFISEEYRLIIDRNYLLISSEAKEEDEVVIDIFENTSALLNPMLISFSKSEDLNIDINENVYQLDHELISFPLKMRKWKAGDRMQPLGMKGQKKISDVLIDKKWDRFKKEKLYVLLSNDEIVCALGIGVSNKFKLSDQTKKVFRIEVK